MHSNHARIIKTSEICMVLILEVFGNKNKRILFSICFCSAILSIAYARNYMLVLMLMSTLIRMLQWILLFCLLFCFTFCLCFCQKRKPGFNFKRHGFNALVRTGCIKKSRRKFKLAAICCINLTARNASNK